MLIRLDIKSGKEIDIHEISYENLQLINESSSLEQLMKRYGNIWLRFYGLDGLLNYYQIHHRS